MVGSTEHLAIAFLIIVASLAYCGVVAIWYTHKLNNSKPPVVVPDVVPEIVYHKNGLYVFDNGNMTFCRPDDQIYMTIERAERIYREETGT